MDYCIIDLGSVFVVLESPKSHVWSAFEWCHLIAQLWRIHYLEFDTDTVVTVCVGTKFCAQLDDVMVCTKCSATSSSSERCRKQRYSLCRHGFTTLCKGLHQTLVWREGGRERSEQGWVENWVRRREHALLGDHQTGCRVKADQRKVLSCQSFAYT